MEKFLKVTHSDLTHVIPVKHILGVNVGANTKVNIFLNAVGHTATNAGETMAFVITATTASDAAKTKEQASAFADLIEEVLQQSWHKPVLDITSRLPYAITGIAQDQVDFSA